MWRIGILALVLMMAWPGVSVAGEDPDVEGVFGLTPVGPNTVVAAWIPLDAGAAIGGLRWYNNDQQTVFPAIYAVAGSLGAPEQLADSVQLLENVTGRAAAWSECSFTVPVASASEGLYVMFQLPEGDEITAEGADGGPGLGYMAGTGECSFWISHEGEQWQRMNPEYQLALRTIACRTKSTPVMVLKPPRRTEEKEAPARALKNSLECSPNPFNPVVKIGFTVSAAGPANVSVFDIRGRKVRSLVDERLAAGYSEVKWYGRDDAGWAVASGCYFVRLTVGGQEMTRRITLVR